MNQEHYIEWNLIARKLKDELSEAEETEFRKWLEAEPVHREYFEKAVRMWNDFQDIPQPDLGKLMERFDRFADQTQQTQQTGDRKAGRIIWLKYAAAILLLLGVAGGILWWQRPAENLPVPVAETVPSPIVPGSPRASIILADGQRLDLSSIGKEGVIQEENGASIRMKGGTVTYEASEKAKEELYNSIVIPKGGEYSLKLADGSMVWLNSNTTLRFPVNFMGKKRVVELEGEAYFEVTKDKTRPFIVKTKGTDIRVYGTAFNVSAYKAENIQHTTLAEGQVGVSRNGKEYHLRPGQQVRIDEKTGLISVEEVNVDLYCSWHKGSLLFENERLEDIMKRLSNWYDVEILFRNDYLRNLHFTGDLERYADFTEILDLIRMTTDVTFEVKDRTVIVKPAEK